MRRRIPTVVALLVKLLLISMAESKVDDLIRHSTYRKWVNRKGSDYTGIKLLGRGSTTTEEPAVVLHWTIDFEKSTIRIAVATKALGWVGLGFSEMGGMLGSDIVYFEASGSRLVDAYATGYARPKIDDQQDWILIDSTAEDGLIIFEAERKLDTGDTLDWPIKDDSNLMFLGTKVIAAWGDTEEMHYHGPDQRLQGTARLFGDPEVNEEETLREQLIRDSEGSVVMQVNHVAVPAKRVTTYVHQCFTTNQFVTEQGLSLNSPLHIIGFEWLLDHGDLIHHMSIYSSPLEEFKACDETGPNSLFYTWGRGSLGKYAFPEDVGILLTGGQGTSENGLGEAPKSFRLEIHYENPKHIRRVKDSSGVRIHYTAKLRKHTAAIMVFGDSRVLLRGKLIGEGLQRHSFHCPESCTSRHVPEEGLTVLHELLHMHKHGMTLHHVHKRGGSEIRRATVQYYDFDQAGAHIVKQEPFKVLPGDSFDTFCNYNGTKDLIFGSSSSQEMCFVYVAYYPASDVHLSCSYRADEAECNADHSSAPIENITLMGKWFGEKQKQDLVLSSSSPPLESTSNGGRVKIQPTENGITWTAIISCIILLAVVVVAIWRRCGMARVYKKVNTSTGDDEGILEEEGGDDGYHCPVGIQGANSSGIRRRLPVS